VEQQVETHLARLCLGCSVVVDVSVDAVLQQITDMQGHEGQVVEGALALAIVSTKKYLQMVCLKQGPLPTLNKVENKVISRTLSKQSGLTSNVPRNNMSFRMSRRNIGNELKALASRNSTPLSVESSCEAESTSFREKHSDSIVSASSSYNFMRKCGFDNQKAQTYTEKFIELHGVSSVDLLLAHHIYGTLEEEVGGVMNKVDARVFLDGIARQSRSSSDGSSSQKITLPSITPTPRGRPANSTGMSTSNTTKSTRL